MERGNKVIEIKNIRKDFGKRTVLKDINFDVYEKEVVSIIGSSGSGKSTLLRCINLLERPTEGEILFHGKDIISGSMPLVKLREKVGMVFQQFNLFNNLSVLDNCVIGQMKVLKKTREEAEKTAKELLAKVGMERFIHAKPAQISGGQKQRVSIARALISKPDVLLLDEPLSALDAKLRQKLLIELDNIHDEVGITFVFVTHDQEEALSVSDRIAVMNKGEVLQIGTPNEIYEMPANGFVADFIGETNFIEGKVTEVYDKYGYAENQEIGRFKIELDKPVKVGDNVKLTLRPEKIKVDTEPRYTDNDNYKVIKGTVDEVIYTGFQSKLFIKVDGVNRIINVYDQHREFLTDEELFEWKEKVYFYWHYEDAYLVEVN